MSTGAHGRIAGGASVLSTPPSSPPSAVIRLHPKTAQDTNSYVGIVIALGSWAMMFAGLFFVYAAARANAASWPPPGIAKLPVTLPFINTLVIAASSISAHLALRALRENRVERAKKLLALTIVLGLAFLELQYLLWVDVARLDIHPGSGVYGSIFYAFTALHAAHIVVGLLGLGVVLLGVFRGAYSGHNWFTVRSVTWFWHFVDVVWSVMFVSMFLL
ncbi:MAG: hypothetical protein NVS3B20_20460 [Polyangiales bacterium]